MPSPSPASADELLGYHLVYEIWMLREIYQRCPHANDKVINNALLESFCVHARNLIEFFEKRAKIYTEASYLPYATSNISQKQRQKMQRRINTQISHLIHDGRTANDLEKINPRERAEILNMLSAEIAEFKANLAQRYKHIDIPDIAPVHSIPYSVGVGQQGATTTITTTTPYIYRQLVPRTQDDR
jgi:hypothetical protein